MRFTRKKDAGVAAVLGCGPAGLFAAYELLRMGWKVEILSKKRRSEMFGAQYLHQPIPYLDGWKEPQSISYELDGTVEEYKRKVYGERPIPFEVSPEKLIGKHPIWDIRRAYNDAWNQLVDHIIDMPDIGADWMMDNVGLYDAIISTIPAPNLCYSGHTFTSQTVWAIGDAPERGIFAPVLVANNTVICDGTKQHGWYRASNIFGYKTAEWPEQSRPPVRDIAEVNKPIATDCNCWDAPSLNFHRAGRYGAWDKRRLSHDGYDIALGLVKGR